MNVKEVLELGKKHDVKFIDLKFIDFPGTWQHTQIPAHRLTEADRSSTTLLLPSDH